jgi:hypothetical protein
MTTKSFTELANGIGKLVEEKNKAYGSAFDRAGDFLRVLYPEGIKPDQYKDMLCIIRVFDKLMRIATSYEGTEEKKVDAYSDLMGYGLLGLRASLTEQENKKSSEVAQKINEASSEIKEEIARKCFEEGQPSKETKIDPFSGIETARWQSLAFPETIPIGKELGKNLRKQKEEDYIRGRNRPPVTPENIQKYRMKVDEK